AATEGVLLDLAPVSLAPHADIEAARAFVAVIEERGDAEVTRSWLGLDPVGEVVRGGFATSADVVTVA
ncbi:MAG: methylmalonyl-CoA mutase, partial [Actinobacteria bacterium]|nr:methylmalonyl-CoA mutase [Actinomycetota bacterium]NIS36513.1 methylmalonyl-CoA mutase [Actinomycetota bacterium]NIT98745.1 methylmalonyl-CoA mutase [Actinomycetota bacterium]NIU22374.1 methylmalonyl-CoA mutase [Actinomycetota bacterium]NIU71015.1 methylmalonyl-CoA mutase [Actinomycetota bacterium]